MNSDKCLENSVVTVSGKIIFKYIDDRLFWHFCHILVLKPLNEDFLDSCWFVSV